MGPVEQSDFQIIERRMTEIRLIPVTPAMQRGWAPKMLKMAAAITEETRTSATPYLPVVSMRSRENAMPGSTLCDV
jgi:hypothetical protein